MTHLLITLIFATLAGSALFALVFLALHSGVWTSALLLAVWIATVALRDSVDLSATFAGVRVTALDVLSAVLIAVAIARVLAGGIGTAGRGLAFLLLLLLAIHIGRGVSEFSLQASVTPARGWLYFTAGLVYGATFPGGWDRRVWRLFASAGLLLVAIAIPYLLIEGVHPASAGFFRNGTWVTSRPIVASGALLMLQAAIILPALGWPSRRGSIYFALATGAVVVAVEHRTVWVAGLVVSLLGFVWWSNRRLRGGDSSALAAIGVVFLALPAAAWGLIHTGPLLTSVKETTAANSTFTWRTTSWHELIGSHHSVSQLIFGQPSGASWNRLIQGRLVDVSPHDGFVDAFLRFGLPGVAVFCALGLILWRRRSAVAWASDFSAGAVGLIILSQFVFSVAYTLDSVQGLIDGIFVSSLVAATVRVSAAAPTFRPALELGRAAQ